ncbi:MAG: ribulose-phosphate 3-epimerase [candidate division WOR-3 bacterium]|nr:MAG: ribulose-phosphate 3-epimerase [candidate division WOR-3 bacterium]
MIVAPSVIAADFSDFQRAIKEVEKAGADLLHLDIMDGVFVPNITFGPMIVQAIDAISDLELDAHLMIIKPEKYLKAFIDAGADWISFHAEATDNPEKCITVIKNHKKKVGLAISPPTPFQNVTRYVEHLNFLLIMSVHPGFYGQKFMPENVKKIEEAKNWIVKKNLSCLIQVDGGINGENACVLKRAGADIIVAGAAVFRSDNYKKAIEDLRCSKV